MNPSELQNYLSIARFSGCPADQMENFAGSGIWLQPKQLGASAAARECDDNNGPLAVGFGGA